MLKILYTLIYVILNAINTPFSNFFKKVKKWYQSMRTEDKVIWFAFAPFYYVLVTLSFLIGFPCGKLEKIIKKY